MNTDERGSMFICTTNPKILCFLQRISVRSPGSARILFTTKTRRREESQRISSRLRVFVVRFFWLQLGCAVFICVHLWFHFVMFTQTKILSSYRGVRHV